MTAAGFRPVSQNEGTRWDIAGVKRAARAYTDRQAGKQAKLQLPRTDPMCALASTGKGLTWEEDGRVLRAQIWAPAPWSRSYWMLVWSQTARFRGEMRLAHADADGHLGLDTTVYNARGEKAHPHDGSPCYGAMSYAHGGCPGCNEWRVITAARR